MILDFRVKNGLKTAHFNLDLHYRVIQLVGDSGVGKSYFAKAFEFYGQGKVLRFDYHNYDLKDYIPQKIESSKAEFIIIDNFDTIGSDILDKYITYANDNRQYIIMSRNFLRCTNGLYNIGTLVSKYNNENNEILYTIDYTQKFG